MSGRASRSRSPLPVPPAEATGGLRLQAASERLAALRFEHERLLRKVELKKKDLEALKGGIADATRILARAQPTRDEVRKIDKELHRLFDELLARKRQPRGAQRMVAFVYQMLCEAGVLSFQHLDDEDDDADFPGQKGEAGEDGEGFRPGGQSHHVPPSGGGGFSARRPSDAPENHSLRGLFRRLAMAIHPDRVHDESEKVRRTELMKEICRAYQEQDLARLLNLERTWMNQDDFVADGDEATRKCATLERTNEALREQLKTVARDLRELRRSPAGQLIKDMRRTAKAGDDLFSAVIAEARVEVARAQAARDFVLRFRDGKMSLNEFVLGPAFLRPASSRGHQSGTARETEGENGTEGGSFVDFMNQLFEEAGQDPTGPRRRGRRGSSRNAKRSGDIPF